MKTKFGSPRFIVWPILLAVLSLCLSACCQVPWGRTPSRYLGREHRQVLFLPDLTSPNDFISISYDKRGSSTNKDVTYVASDGETYTQEFNDMNVLQGRIHWIWGGKRQAVFQSRALSRFTGITLDLNLPEDCKRILGVEIVFESKGERTKNLTYLSTDGRIMSKEYREGLIDRRFGGWLEITGPNLVPK